MQNRRAFLTLLSGIPFLGFLSPIKKMATAAQEDLVWGTYGKNACHYPRLVLKRLVDCDTDHLIAILETQQHITASYDLAIRNILKDRHAS